MLKNNPTKVQIISLASALLLAFNLNAAEPSKTHPENKKEPQDRFEMMSKKLELTEKQKNDLKPMLEKLKKNRTDTLKQLDEQEEKELSTILKPEQVNQVSRYLKRGQRMHSGNHDMRRGDMEKRKMKNNDSQQGMHPRPPAKLPKNEQ